MTNKKIQVAIEQNPYTSGVLLYTKSPRTEMTIEEFEDFAIQVSILKKKLGIKEEVEKRPIDDFFYKN